MRRLALYIIALVACALTCASASEVFLTQGWVSAYNGFAAQNGMPIMKSGLKADHDSSFGKYYWYEFDLNTGLIIVPDESGAVSTLAVEGLPDDQRLKGISACALAASSGGTMTYEAALSLAYSAFAQLNAESYGYEDGWYYMVYTEKDEDGEYLMAMFSRAEDAQQEEIPSEPFPHEGEDENGSEPDAPASPGQSKDAKVYKI